MRGVRWVAIVTIAAASIVARTAEADEVARDSRLAQALFEQAKTLMDRGDLDQACRLFRESQRLDPGVGAILNLAHCHERQGKLATAWAEYYEALSAASQDQRDDRREFARLHIDALAPRLPKLRIVVTDADPNLLVRLDATVLSAVSYGLESPVDPGEHVVAASSPGRVAWSTKVVLAEGERREVVVAPLVTASPVRVERKLAPMSYVLGGVALGALGTSVVTGILALGAQSSAEDKCIAERSYCPDPSYSDDVSRARTFAWVSTAALGVGIGAAVGAIFWPRRTVTVDATSAGVQVGFRLSM